MPDIALSEAQQRALRALAATEPVPGSPLPDRRLLEQVSVLIPCEAIRVTLAEPSGGLLDAVSLSHPPREDEEPQPLEGPPLVGLQWACRQGGSPPATDTLSIGYGNGPDLVVTLWMDRHRRPFTLRDVAVLHLLEPILQRVFRERASPHLPHDLTVQERRVLRLVAAGLTNAEIAERLGIAPSTVRKHLEHAFPKLGVTSRFAAAIAFGGPGRVDHEPVPTPGRFA